jgi:hypothetical protein
MDGEQAVTEAVHDRGLLLLQDRKLTCAVRIVSGGVVQGSWWSHPEANRIYAVLEDVTRRPEILVAKLVSGKVTLIHRRLWPAFISVATAREAWQMRGLSTHARRMLGVLDEGDVVEPAGAGAKEIEARLLAFAEKVHTPSGRHVTRLEPWPTWMDRMAVAGGSLRPEEAKRQLESALAGIGGEPELFPWNTIEVKRR